MRDKRFEIANEIQTLESIGGNSTEIQRLKYQYQAFDAENQTYELSLVSSGSIEIIEIEGFRNALIIFEMHKRIGKSMNVDFLLLTDERGSKRRSFLIK